MPPFFIMSTFNLEQHQIEEYMVEVITGKRIFTDGELTYAVCFPTIENRDKARLIYMKHFKKMTAAGMPTKQEMQQRITKMGLLPPDFYPSVSKMKAEIEAIRNAKEMTNSKHQIAELDFQMETLQHKLYNLKIKELAILMNTADAKAEEVKSDYLVSVCTLCGEELDERYWSNYTDFLNSSDMRFATFAKRQFLELSAGLSPTVIRALARNVDWRRRWKASKQASSPIFEGSSADWDRNKVEICYWSDFYDSIFSYHTPPSEDIINDDDSLFEWIRNVNRLNASGGKAETKSQGQQTKKVNTPYKIRPNVKKK